ncbi:ATP-NAD kinase family protein [Amphritea sp. 2_MG-2023]|uniref:ATP-NAD kinase family protein n=1 Tax=Amphritea TaxID=515417 RepID=UPI001C0702A3|nr:MULTISPECIES: ATP-NAD kinase family protein [Amphritea]MBU2966369.1 ATP-NAD kinase family protein [Amphritea atlantica]MDO6419807.1 ATP-NAD kinase family protein [Amphritea sp. 2_MG-2023]
MFRLGLIVNPLAGVGGSVALKGSDGDATAQKALSMGAEPKANLRTQQALAALAGLDIELLTYPGEMGEDCARLAGFEPRVIGSITAGQTRAEDTERAAQAMAAQGVDLILFAGGDGTARNICHAIGDSTPVLGVPAGVKIHSGVYAVTPKAAGEVVAMLVRGELVTLADQEVRDIDEAAFREGRVRAKYYGELLVPEEGRFLQHVKHGGREVEELVLDDIAADFAENMQDDVRYIMGSGSTVQALMDNLGLENTLLGVDLIENGELIGQDLTAHQLLDMTAGFDTKLVITVIGGQGHIIGRGNQQLSPELLRRLGRENIIVVATKSKIKALEGRPLIVDSGDLELNHQLAGLIRVVTGYRDAILYRVADL